MKIFAVNIKYGIKENDKIVDKIFEAFSYF